MLRQRIDDLTVLSRVATGFRLQKIPADDSVVMVDIIPHSAILNAEGSNSTGEQDSKVAVAAGSEQMSY